MAVTVPLSRFPNLSQPATLNQGRALFAAPIFHTRNVQSEVVGQLWPDSLVTLLDADSEWYRVPSGFVSRTNIQPMVAYSPNVSIANFNGPFWAEVAGPVTSVRTTCAANAPLVTRVGHGGVLRVVDYLPSEPHGWYGVADEQDQFLGWTQAVFWRPVDTPFDNHASGEQQLLIDRETHKLTVIENDEPVLQAFTAIDQSLPSGQYSVYAQQMSGRGQGYGKLYHGIPWQTYFGANYSIAGVYWHNRFGETVPGPAIQTTPVLARWLYSWLNDQTRIVVI